MRADVPTEAKSTPIRATRPERPDQGHHTGERSRRVQKLPRGAGGFLEVCPECRAPPPRTAGCPADPNAGRMAATPSGASGRTSGHTKLEKGAMDRRRFIRS